MTVTGQRIAAAGRFDQDVCPEDPGFDVDGRDLEDADADFVLAEPRTFMPDDGLVGHFDDRGEKMIPVRPATRLKDFRIHAASVLQKVNLSKRV